jgi:hypothetical protein
MWIVAMARAVDVQHVDLVDAVCRTAIVCRRYATMVDAIVQPYRCVVLVTSCCPMAHVRHVRLVTIPPPHDLRLAQRSPVYNVLVDSSLRFRPAVAVSHVTVVHTVQLLVYPIVRLVPPVMYRMHNPLLLERRLLDVPYVQLVHMPD